MTIRALVLRRLSDWAEYKAIDRGNGYPSHSSAQRALESALRATKTDGMARWRGKVHMGQDYRGRDVYAAREAPPMAKETRPTVHTVIPRVHWGYAPVEKIDMLLKDLAGENEFWAKAVKLKAKEPKEPSRELAKVLNVQPRQFRRLRQKGLDWLVFWYRP